jgi:glutamyl-tRNA synthetase
MSLSAPRVRFAPSPTGFVHVGSLRTALYNYLFAKKNGGTYILRIEDTDQSRFVPGSIENLVKNFALMGLNADEGVIEENGHIVERGDKGPYQQSKRLPVYKEHAEKLVATSHAYYCFCSPERLAALRTEQQKNKKPPRYDKHCLALTPDEVSERRTKETHVIRFNVPPGETITFTDLVRGQISFSTNDIDDQVLLKTDGFPTYHLAVVVDDHLMNITHVLRSEEWLPSTPKHILLYKAFGFAVPAMGHVSVILGPDGKKKLSKRDGGAAVEDFLRAGYLKEALINFFVLLGWNPGAGSTQEIFSLAELETTFDLKGLHKAGAVLDYKKLDWMNGEYIKKMSLGSLYEEMVAGEFFDKEFIKSAPIECQTEEYLKRVLTVEQERLATLGGFGIENLFFFTEELSYEPSLLTWKENTKEQTRESLEQAKSLVASLTAETLGNKEALQEVLLEAAGEKRGDFLWPLRVALSGAQKSPSPADLVFVLGQKTAIERLAKAINQLA